MHSGQSLLLILDTESQSGSMEYAQWAASAPHFRSIELDLWNTHRGQSLLLIWDTKSLVLRNMHSGQLLLLISDL